MIAFSFAYEILLVGAAALGCPVEPKLDDVRAAGRLAVGGAEPDSRGRLSYNKSARALSFPFGHNF
jgi:hypothetical protein